MTSKASPQPALSASRCATCRYLMAGREGWYECRRREPQISIQRECDDEAINPVTLWPRVSKDDWCGEYAPKGGGRKR